jgi:hypothetical protein
MATFKKDYQDGKEDEIRVLPIITKYFNKDISLSSKKTDVYDFKDTEGTVYELKRRNNRHNSYPTTIIGINKIQNNNCILLFDFSDGLYFIKYDKTLFDTFQRNLFVRNKRLDYHDVEKEYLFIPIDKLTLIDED